MIYVECDTDVALVKNLDIPKKEIIHAGNKGNVCNRLRKTKNSIGLIDEDPQSGQPRYIKNLSLIHI